MPSVKRNIFALVVAVALLVPTFAPNVSFAAGCECFCGIEGKGATDVNAEKSTVSPVASSEVCAAACTLLSAKMVGCYTDESDYPVHSAKCWREKECTDHYQTVYGERVGSYWGTTMPYDCSVTKTNSEPMHYCYADDTAIALNVPIGSISEVQSFASYIGIIYDWLLPAGALIAVVMMMFGGLQYILSRGKEKYISKGKERITNAITGIILLLSVFVLLNLIDPRLTILNSLKVPLIKTLTILNAGDSCENLNDIAKIVTSPKTGTCGDKGTVSDISGVSDQVVSSWKVGNECTFMTCPHVGETCFLDGSDYACSSCSTVSTPSEATCSAFSASNVSATGDGIGSSQINCSYSAKYESCIAVQTLGTSTAGSYDCLQMQATAGSQSAKNGCEFYEDLYLRQNNGEYSVTYPITSEFGINVGGDKLLEQICTGDASGCQLYRKGLHGESATGCHYTQSSVATTFGNETHYLCEPVVSSTVDTGWGGEFENRD